MDLMFLEFVESVRAELPLGMSGPDPYELRLWQVKHGEASPTNSMNPLFTGCLWAPGDAALAVCVASYYWLRPDTSVSDS